MKKKYFVSVQNEAIFEEEGIENFEFEIMATEDDYEELQQMFTDGEQVDNSTFIKAHIPGVPYHNDPENDAYDDQLKRIYQKIHQLGTLETKEHIERMDIL